MTTHSKLALNYVTENWCSIGDPCVTQDMITGMIDVYKTHLGGHYNQMQQMLTFDKMCNFLKHDHLVQIKMYITNSYFTNYSPCH